MLKRKEKKTKRVSELDASGVFAPTVKQEVTLNVLKTQITLNHLITYQLIL